MLSIIIPAGKHPAALKQTLQSIGKAKNGVSEIIIAGDDSADAVKRVAKDHDALWITAPATRGGQKAAAAEKARGEWLLFLHPGAALQAGWLEEINQFTSEEKNTPNAAVFRYQLNDTHPIARQLETLFRWGNRWVGTSGAQGLLLHRDLYQQLGGFKAYDRFEDIDLTRNLLRRKDSTLMTLQTAASVDAGYYRKHGYMLGPVWQLTALYFYILGLPPAWVAKLLAEGN